MASETVILAYSGGLDTSCILKWLLEKKYKVVCYMANIGQEEDFEAARQKALKIGATDVVIEDLKEEFVENYIWPAIQMGLIYEQRYLLGTSLARPCISVGIIKCLKKYNAQYISHGATGKGNDQIRFELSCYALHPSVKVKYGKGSFDDFKRAFMDVVCIHAPWRMTDFCTKFQGRQDLLKYAELHKIPVSVTPKAPWSMDANFMHISYESGILENPENVPPEDLFQMTTSPKKAPDTPYKLQVVFENGLPIKLVLQDGKTLEKPVKIFAFLNKIGGEHGIGRIDIVENRFIGLKSRGVYETPGGQILYIAHVDLEVFCLDKEVLRLKQYLRDKMADFIYNGFWFSPEGNYTRKCLTMSQEGVSGKVLLELYKGNVTVLGRNSDVSLYNEDLVSMDKHADFSPADATGFINIQAIRLKEYHRYQEQGKRLTK